MAISDDFAVAGSTGGNLAGRPEPERNLAQSYNTEMPLGFQIWVGKQYCGGHNMLPWLE